MANSYYTNDQSDDDYSLSEYGSIHSHPKRNNTNKKGRKFIPNDKRGMEASMYSVMRYISTNGEEPKLKKIKLFNSSLYTNSPIINAVSGLAYYRDGRVKYKIGSVHEDDLFKVRFLTREGGIPGITLFYDSPDQYERPLGGLVHPAIKEKCLLRQKGYDQKWLK